QHVVAVDHGGVGRVTVAVPDRAAVEGVQRLFARGHVGERAEPDERVRVAGVAELADDAHPRLLLRLDALAAEQLAERLAPPRPQGGAAQLDDGVRVGRGHRWSRSFVDGYARQHRARLRQAAGAAAYPTRRPRPEAHLSGAVDLELPERVAVRGAPHGA